MGAADRRLTSAAAALAATALEQCLTANETLEWFDIVPFLAQGPSGMQVAAVVHVAVKGPLLGSILTCSDVVSNLEDLTDAEMVTAAVRRCLGFIRGQWAEIMSEALRAQ